MGTATGGGLRADELLARELDDAASGAGRGDLFLIDPRVGRNAAGGLTLEVVRDGRPGEDAARVLEAYSAMGDAEASASLLRERVADGGGYVLLEAACVGTL